MHLINYHVRCFDILLLILSGDFDIDPVFYLNLEEELRFYGKEHFDWTISIHNFVKIENFSNLEAARHNHMGEKN